METEAQQNEASKVLGETLFLLQQWGHLYGPQVRKLVEGREKGKQGKEERKEEIVKIKKESMERKNWKKIMGGRNNKGRKEESENEGKCE